MAEAARDPLFEKLSARVKRAWEDASDRRKSYAQARKLLRGDDKSPANMIWSTIHALVPALYAKDPDFSIRPHRAEEALIQAARNAENLLSKLLREARLKKKAKRCVMAACVSPPAILKVTYQRCIGAGPIGQDRINDQQDNIIRLEHELDEVARDPHDEESAAEAEQIVRGLMSRAELAFGEGLVLDFVHPEDFVWDDAIATPADLERADWCAQRIWMREEQAEALFGPDAKDALEKATHYARPRGNEEEEWKADAGGENEQWVAVWEYWDRSLGRVFTWAEGGDRWLREPFTPRTGLRFFPFFPLILFDDDQGKPLSLVDLLAELQKEYDETRKALREHRARAMPRFAVNAEFIEPADLKKLARAEAWELVPLRLAGTTGIDQVIQQFRAPLPQPQLYDTGIIRAEMDAVSGVQDAMRGGVIKAKTATEAAIIQQGMSGRIGEMRDRIEDWLEDIARYAVSLILLHMDSETASMILGKPVVMPAADVDHAQRLFEIEIQAGTTGKPNEAIERQNWMQLLPLLTQLYQQAMQMMQAGQDPRPIVEVIKETLRRFDERLDLDRFLPAPLKEAEDGGNGAAAAGIAGAAGIGV